jgi:hypothetical protein
VLSARLLDRIDRNWERIAAEVIAHCRRDARLRKYHSLSDAEIRERARDLVRNLRLWLEGMPEEDLHRRYQELGQRRFRAGVPLHELVLMIQLIKRKIATFATEQNPSLTALELYEEMELLRVLGRYFDHVVHSAAEGYEEELRRRPEGPVLELPKAVGL